MNDGLRFVIYWSFTDLGEEHQNQRGYPTIIEASQAVSYRRQPTKAAQTRTRLGISIVGTG
jgi:hypothetical protein